MKWDSNKIQNCIDNGRNELVFYFKRQDNDFEKMKLLFSKINELSNFRNLKSFEILNENEKFYNSNKQEELRIIFESFNLEKSNTSSSSLKSIKFDDYFKFKLHKGLLPFGLKELDCGKNNFEKIEIGVLPNGLEVLKTNLFDDNPEIGIFPNSLTELYCGTGKYGQVLLPGLFPSNLKILRLPQQFNHSLSIEGGTVGVGLLSNIKNLTNLSFQELIEKPGYFNQKINFNDIPSSVTRLILPECFQQSIESNNLPNGLKVLKFTKSCEQSFQQPLLPNSLPSGLETLRFNPGYNQPLQIGSIPNSVKKLTFKNSFNQHVSNGILPTSLTCLKFGFLWNKEIDNSFLNTNNLVKLYFETGLIKSYYNNNTSKIKVPKLPSTLKSLYLSPKFILDNNSISNGLITFGCSIIEHLQYLPNSVLKVKFVDDFNQVINENQLPINLKSIKFGEKYNIPLIFSNRLKSLESIEFGKNFDQFFKLPNTIKCLIFGENFKKSFQPPPLQDNEKDNQEEIEYFKIDDYKIGERINFSKINGYENHIVDHPLSNEYSARIIRIKQIGDYVVLPSNLKSLYLSWKYNKSIKPLSLPPSLLLLELGTNFTQTISSDWLPISINSIIIRSNNLKLNLKSIDSSFSNLSILTHSFNYSFFNINKSSSVNHIDYNLFSKFIKITNESIYDFKNLAEEYVNNSYFILHINCKNLFKKLNKKIN